MLQARVTCSMQNNSEVSSPEKEVILSEEGKMRKWRYFVILNKADGRLVQALSYRDAENPDGDVALPTRLKG